MSINENLEQIKKVFLDDQEVCLGKQMKHEYILYSFSGDNSTVRRKCKQHYANSSMTELRKESENTLSHKSLAEIIDNNIFELLMCGYQLVKAN